MVDTTEYQLLMDEAVSQFEQGLTQIRTSGANPNLVANIEVDYYGMATPINQISQIQVVEGKQLLIKPYEHNIVKDIEKAIFKANIGLTPQNEGTQIRIVVPPLTEERRKEYTVKVKNEAEEAKVAVRNIRRDANEAIKKDKTIPEDTAKDLQNEVQDLTDAATKRIDEIAARKNKEIMTL
jgi:ribosome recycling factor